MRSRKGPQRSSFHRPCGLLSTQIDLKCWDNRFSKANLCQKSSEVSEQDPRITNTWRLKIPNSGINGGKYFFLTIHPPAYILVGFAALAAWQYGGGGANSRTYDQGPALLSRSLF